MPFACYVVPDFRVSQRTEWNPDGILREEIKMRKGIQEGNQGGTERGLTWLIFELRLQMEVTKLI